MVHHNLGGVHEKDEMNFKSGDAKKGRVIINGGPRPVVQVQLIIIFLVFFVLTQEGSCVLLLELGSLDTMFCTQLLKLGICIFHLLATRFFF